MAIYDERERERERERVIKRWQASIFACILAIFASLAFTSVTAFADVGDANVSINWGSPDPYSLIPNPSLSEDSDQEASTDGSRVAMFRLYNKWTGEHFYTSSKSERDNIVKAGWVYEQIEWYAPTSEDFKPVYRLYNKYVEGGDHHYTTSADEKDECVKAGWTYEGEGWRTVEAGATDYVKVLRQYNPYAATGTHNYTTDEDEQKYLVSLGWRAEADGGWGGYSKLEPTTPTPTTTFTVTFNSNGGSAVATQTVKKGKTATKPTDPTKTGYTFDGWYLDSALTKSFNFSTPITANTTLYAKWKNVEEELKSKDSDGDGLSDYVEIYISGTDPYSYDAPGSGSMKQGIIYADDANVIDAEKAKKFGLVSVDEDHGKNLASEDDDVVTATFASLPDGVTTGSVVAIPSNDLCLAGTSLVVDKITTNNNSVTLQGHRPAVSQVVEYMVVKDKLKVDTKTLDI